MNSHTITRILQKDTMEHFKIHKVNCVVARTMEFHHTLTIQHMPRRCKNKGGAKNKDE